MELNGDTEMNWLKNRFAEKSTWAGLITILATVYTGPYGAIVGPMASTLLGVLGGGLVAHKEADAKDK